MKQALTMTINDSLSSFISGTERRRDGNTLHDTSRYPNHLPQGGNGIKGRALALIFLFSFGLTSCAVTNENVGTLTGGVVGGLVGSQFGGGSGKVAAAAGGALLGAFLGGQIGKTMDRLDRLEMQRALETAPTGKPIAWSNPDSGNRYTVVPTKTYYQNKQPCREYTTRAIIGGKMQEVYGRACRQADGSWKVVS